MRITEFTAKKKVVAEYERRTVNSERIFSELKKAGYSYVGGGVDATVWARDDGEVLKVLMPSENKAAAESSFLLFHDACVKMKNNPHVPRFVDEYSVFEINGVDYVQITMERLNPIKKGSIDQAMVWALSDLCTNDYLSWDDVTLQLEDPKFWSQLSFMTTSMRDRALRDIHNYWSLFETMQAFYKIAQQNSLGWDLHTENVMQRRDGTLVITDPFMVS
jgi:hypothetical protein